MYDLSMKTIIKMLLYLKFDLYAKIIVNLKTKERFKIVKCPTTLMSSFEMPI